MTRDTNSEKAKALAALGVEVVKANLSNKSEVLAAFKGAYGGQRLNRLVLTVFRWTGSVRSDKLLGRASAHVERLQRRGRAGYQRCRRCSGVQGVCARARAQRELKCRFSRAGAASGVQRAGRHARQEWRQNHHASL